MYVSFYRLDAVFDEAGKRRRPPDDLVGWFRRHPSLNAEAPVEVTVGGVTGSQLDASVAEVEKRLVSDCKEPCMLIGQASGGPSLSRRR